MRKLAALSLALFAASCAAVDAPSDQSLARSKGALTFVVIGDTPYGPEDEAMLAAAKPRIKALKPDFVIHVGDFKGGKAPCDGEADDALASLMEELAPITVFFTPGDNDWTDCDRNNDPSTGAPYSELGRLDVLRARFFSEPPAGASRFGWRNQDGTPENATWRADNVRFATLHVTGTANGRAYVGGDPLELALEAVEARERAARLWIEEAVATAKAEKAKALVFAMQADPTETGKFTGVRCEGVVEKDYACDAFIDFRAALRAAATAFGGPTLLIHGDTEPFTLNQDLLDGAAPNLWRLNAAGDAGVGETGLPYGVRDVTEVLVDIGASAPFRARGLTTGVLPKDK